MLHCYFFFNIMLGLPVSNLLNKSEFHLGKTEKMLACQVSSFFFRFFCFVLKQTLGIKKPPQSFMLSILCWHSENVLLLDFNYLKGIKFRQYIISWWYFSEFEKFNTHEVLWNYYLNTVNAHQNTDYKRKHIKKSWN